MSSKNKFKQNIKPMIICIFIATFFLGILLFNQSKLVQLGFSNANLEREIKKEEVLNAQRRNKLVGKMSVENIKQRARALGLVDPQSDQVRKTKNLVKDEVVIFGKDKKGDQNQVRKGGKTDGQPGKKTQATASTETDTAFTTDSKSETNKSSP